MKVELKKARPFWGLAYRGRLLRTSEGVPRIFKTKEEIAGREQLGVKPVKVFLVVEDD